MGTIYVVAVKKDGTEVKMGPTQNNDGSYNGFPDGDAASAWGFRLQQNEKANPNSDLADWFWDEF